MGHRGQPAQGGERASAGCKRSTGYEPARDAKFPANFSPKSTARPGLAVAPGRALDAGQGAGTRGVGRPAHGNSIRQRLGPTRRSPGAAGGRQNRRFEGSNGAGSQGLDGSFSGWNPAFQVRLGCPERGTRFHRFETELDRFRQGGNPRRRSRLIAHAQTGKKQNETRTGQSDRATYAASTAIRHRNLHTGHGPIEIHRVHPTDSVGLVPVQASTDIHLQGHTQAGGRRHQFTDSEARLFQQSLGHLEYQLIVHLHDHAHPRVLDL